MIPPAFEQEFGVDTDYGSRHRPISKLGEDCNADVVLVHARREKTSS